MAPFVGRTRMSTGDDGVRFLTFATLALMTPERIDILSVGAALSALILGLVA